MFSRKRPQQKREPLKRGRTGPAYSYYSNQTNDSQKTRSRNMKMRLTPGLNKWVNRLITLAAGSAIFVSFVYILSLNANPKVIQLNDAGNLFLHSSTTYQQAASKLFASSWLNKNKITVNTAKVTAKLKEQFPELDQVIITLPLINHRPIVYLLASRPSIVLSTNSGKYILNEKGIAVKNWDSLTDQSFKLTTVDDESQLSTNLGQQVLPEQQVGFIFNTLAWLNQKGQTIQKATLPNSYNELDIQIKDRPKIKMNILEDAKEQVGAALAALSYVSKKNLHPSYIDVRVVGRVYYK